MIFFFDANGALVYRTPGSLKQGSARANEIAIVAPFASSSVLTIDFWLPNGKTLGHSFVDSESTEYDLAASEVALDYHAPDGSILNLWTYDVRSVLTDAAGTLAFRVNVGTIDGDIIPLDLINVEVSNGIPNIPSVPDVPQDADEFYEDIITYISGAINAKTEAEDAARDAIDAKEAAEAARDEANATLSDTVKKNTEGSSSLLQTINSSITITGDLNVNGTTTTVNHETLTVNDNIIVTNAGDTNTPISALSGLVINTGELASDGVSYKGYGIVFVPPIATEDNPTPDISDGTVKLGLGTITRTDDELSEFTFDEGEAQTVATRDGFEEAASNIIPMWDSVKNAFVPSGKTASDFVPVVADKSFLPRYAYGKDYLGNIVLIPIGNFQEAFTNSQPLPAYLGAADNTADNFPRVDRDENQPLHLWTADPTRAYHAVNKKFLEDNYVPSRTPNGTQRVYTQSRAGVNNSQLLTSDAVAWSVPQRDVNGNVKTNTPANDLDAVNKAYGDTHYVPIYTEGNVNQLYSINNSGANTVIGYSSTVLNLGIVQRTVSGNIYLPDQIAAPPNQDTFAISKAYGDASYSKFTTEVYRHELSFHSDSDTFYIITVYNQASASMAYDNVEDTINLIAFPVDYIGQEYNDTTGQYESIKGTFQSSAELLAKNVSYTYDDVTSLSDVLDEYSKVVYRHEVVLGTSEDNLTIRIFNTRSTPFANSDIENIIKMFRYSDVKRLYSTDNGVRRKLVFISSYTVSGSTFAVRCQNLDETYEDVTVSELTDSVSPLSDYNFN